MRVERLGESNGGDPVDDLVERHPLVAPQARSTRDSLEAAYWNALSPEREHGRPGG